MEKFKQLNLSEDLLEAIRREGFDTPSEIQEKTIPLVLAGKDVIGSSETGSGKTLAFGAGIIDRVTAGAGIQALILTPTRELAEQVGQTISKFANKKRLRVTQVYGGVSMDPQIRAMRQADIVVGTPGRLLDHLERRT
ncbi:MAG: DEAD/DEAH box helicase, partial [Nanoarchaeota archaeon]